MSWLGPIIISGLEVVLEGWVGDNPGCSPELTGAGFVGLVRVGFGCVVIV